MNSFKILCKLKIIVFLLVVSAFSVLKNADAQDIIRIMPLGNSLTWGNMCTSGSIYTDCKPLGGNSAVSYRKKLKDLLSNDGYTIDFVGKQQAGGYKMDDPDNSGFGGITADKLADIMETGTSSHTGYVTSGPYMNSYPADIVLLQVGTNDALRNYDNMNGLDRILDAIDNYEQSSGNPVTVFVAKIVSFRNYSCGTYQPVKTINQQIQSIVNRRISQGDDLVLVDMECDAGLNYFSDMADEVHPAQSGYDKMGVHWYNILSNYLGTNFVSYTIAATSSEGGSIYPSGNVTVREGENKSFSITANAGYEIQDVVVNGNSIGAASQYQFVNVQSNQTIEATFSKLDPIITAVANSNGSIQPSGNVTVPYGGSKTFSITASEGYQVKDVQVNSTSVGKPESYTFTNVTSSKRIEVWFEKTDLTISTIVSGNGNIDPSGPVTVSRGSDKYFRFIPDQNHKIDEILINGQSIGAPGDYTFSNLQDDQRLEVRFSPITHTITALVNGKGSINPSGETIITQGESQSFRITADAGWQIQNLKIDGQSQGVLNAYTFNNVNNSHTIEVWFEKTDLTISTIVSGNGNIDPSGPVTVSRGSDKYFRFIPDQNHKIDEVLINGQSIGAPGDYTFSNLQDDQRLEVRFSPITHTITALVNGKGSINPSGETIITQGESQSFTFIPDEGYQVKEVKVDGVSIGNQETYTFDNIMQSHRIEVSFESTRLIIITSVTGNGQIDPEGPVSVARGKDQTFSIIPGQNYKTSEILINNESINPVGEYEFINVQSDQKIEAKFIPITHIISVKSNENGSVEPSGDIDMKQGDSLTIKITPDDGYKINEVIIDGDSLGVVEVYHFDSIYESHHVEVYFEREGYTVTTYLTGKGQIDPPGPLRIFPGEDYIFSFLPDPYYKVTDVLINGVSIGAAEDYTLRGIEKDMSIEVIFTRETCTILSSVTGGGSISPEGIVVLEKGDSALFIIKPDTGYQIEDVLVDGSSAGKADRFLFETVLSDHLIQAIFTLKTYEISAGSIGDGSISPSGTVIVDHGKDQTFIITPEANTGIKEFLVDSVEINPALTYTFSNVKENHSIYIVFNEKIPTAIAKADLKNESALIIYPNPNQGTFRISMAKGHIFTGVFPEIKIFNIFGKQVYHQAHTPGSEGNSIEITMPNALPGIYILQVSGGGQTKAYRFIRE